MNDHFENFQKRRYKKRGKRHLKKLDLGKNQDIFKTIETNYNPYSDPKELVTVIQENTLAKIRPNHSFEQRRFDNNRIKV